MEFEGSDTRTSKEKSGESDGAFVILRAYEELDEGPYVDAWKVCGTWAARGREADESIGAE